MSAITLSTDRWPIALFTFEGQPKDADIQFFIDAVEEIHARGEIYASIGYLKQAKADIAQINQIGKAMLKNWPLAKKYCCGSAIVLSSPVLRFLLSSFFLITPIPYPHIITNDLDEAIEWVTKQLLDAGQKVPPPKAR